jgi:uncharacterized protein with HEPN domain
VKPVLARGLEDLLAQAAAAARLVARGKAAYDADEMLRYAAEDLLLRLGECARRVERADPAFPQAHPEVELRRLIYSRNVVAHGYDMVDHEIVWAILATNIPALAAAAQAALAAEADDE